MVNKISVAVKIVILILFIAVSIGPVIYGLMEYNWNFAEFIMPIYQPPNIGFNTDIYGFEISGEKLYIILLVENMGEIKIEISSMEASLYGIDDRYITNIGLEESVKIFPGESGRIYLYIIISPETIKNVMGYYMDTGSTMFKVKGTLEIKVYSSIVQYPLQMDIKIPKDIILELLGV